MVHHSRGGWSREMGNSSGVDVHGGASPLLRPCIDRSIFWKQPTRELSTTTVPTTQPAASHPLLLDHLSTNEPSTCHCSWRRCHSYSKVLASLVAGCYSQATESKEAPTRILLKKIPIITFACKEVYLPFPTSFFVVRNRPTHVISQSRRND